MSKVHPSLHIKSKILKGQSLQIEERCPSKPKRPKVESYNEPKVFC